MRERAFGADECVSLARERKKFMRCWARYAGARARLYNGGEGSREFADVELRGRACGLVWGPCMIFIVFGADFFAFAAKVSKKCD